MALKINFGEKSLPLEVRNYISKNIPDLPRAFTIGLKAISDTAFRDDPNDNLARFDEALDVYSLACLYAPEYYTQNNSQMPDHVLTVLAGEIELEHSEELDSLLPDKAAALLAEVRAIRRDPDLLNDPKTSVDATFVSLIKYCDEIMCHQKALLCGDEVFDSESYDVLHQAKYDYFRDHLLDGENSTLENMILQKIQAINFLRQNENSGHFWYLPIMRANDFHGLEDDELIQRCGLPLSNSFESAFSLAHKKSYHDSNSDLDIGFAQMAENQITPLRRYLEMSPCNDPVLISYLLVEHDLYDPEFMEGIINGMGEDGEKIAYFHAALNDTKMWETLTPPQQYTILDFALLKKALQLEYEHAFLRMMSPDQEQYNDLAEEIAERIAEMQSSNNMHNIHSEKIRAFFLHQLKSTEEAPIPIPEKITSGSWYPEPGQPANSNNPLPA